MKKIKLNKERLFNLVMVITGLIYYMLSYLEPVFLLGTVLCIALALIVNAYSGVIKNE
jgi:hypothetical protein